MIYGEKNHGEEKLKLKSKDEMHSYGFYPEGYGATETSDPKSISVGVLPSNWKYDKEIKEEEGGGGSTDRSMNLKGADGYHYAISEIIIPYMEKFDPQLLIISAGFDGYHSDPIGGELRLSSEDYSIVTKKLLHSMSRPEGSGKGRVISLLEGGYDTSHSLGLAKCVDAHVHSLRSNV